MLHVKADLALRLVLDARVSELHPYDVRWSHHIVVHLEAVETDVVGLEARGLLLAYMVAAKEEMFLLAARGGNDAASS